jgi:hypothetical protein
MWWRGRAWPTRLLSHRLYRVDRAAGARRLLPADWPYTVNAVSGYSGGGKALIERFEEDRDIAFRAYGLGMGHKHVPEMTRYAGLVHEPIFAPSVIPAHRGMWVEVPLPLSAIPARLRRMPCAKVWPPFTKAARWSVSPRRQRRRTVAARINGTFRRADASRLCQ